MAALRKAGCQIELLFGDTADAVSDLADAVGIDNWQAGLRPDDKVARVRPLTEGGARVLMVGDGLNDSLSFDEALCRATPAVDRAVMPGKSDFYFLGDGIEAVLYTPRERRTFAHATAVLDELGMTIVDARIVSLDNDHSIVTLVFMEQDARVESDEARINKVRRALTRILTAPSEQVLDVTRTLPRQARMFTTHTTVEFGQSTSGDQTVFELQAADRPGLLSIIGQVFIEQGIDIEAAKIVTIGEKAEDVFYICRESGGALDRQQQETLGAALLERLDSTTRT